MDQDVFGMDDAKPKDMMPPLVYLGVWIAALTGLIFVPTHVLLKRTCPPAAKSN